MIVATAGHVDHGKTALVRALTGVDTDRLAEEKRRGMTIDLGFAYREAPGGGVLGFVDVPGHEKFVRTMLAGVSGVDFALVVVAADDGPMPQTREHLDIVALLAIARGAVAITKSDLADEARLAEVEAEVTALLAETPLAGAPLFRVSSATGTGIEPLLAHLGAEARMAGARAGEGRFRLAIDRAFTIAGAGVIVTGTAFSGRVAIGDALVLSPSGKPVRVRGLHAQNRECASAGAGERCAINIAGAGIGKDDIRRGDWIVDPVAHAPTDRLDARLVIAAGAERALANWTPVHLHVGADDVPARVALLEGSPIEPGATALVRLALARPVGALAGDRFILRDQSARRTIAGGRVIDPFPPARGRARPERLVQLRALEAGDPVQALDGLLAVSPGGVDLAIFATARNLTEAETGRVFTGASMLRRGGAGIAPGHDAALKDRIAGALGAFHEARPDRLGPDRAVVARGLGGKPLAGLVDGAIDELLAQGRIATRGPLLHLAGFSPRLAPAQDAAWRAIAPVLERAGLAPPVVHEIAKALGQDAAGIARALRHAESVGLVVRIGKNRFALPETVERLAATAEDLARAGMLTASEFRSKAGIGRNLAIEVLEHFDRVGLTRRVGDLRHLAKDTVQREASP